MKIYFYIFFMVTLVFSDNIDKQRILEIITNAKNGKNMKKDNVQKNDIVIYRRKDKFTEKKKTIFGQLPQLMPTSVMLKQQFYDTQKEKQYKKVVPKLQNQNNTIKTTATQIQYY